MCPSSVTLGTSIAPSMPQQPHQSRALVTPVDSSSPLVRPHLSEGEDGPGGFQGAEQGLAVPACGGLGALPQAPEGLPPTPRPGFKPQGQWQSRAGGKFPLALCPGCLGATVPAWADRAGSRVQTDSLAATGSCPGPAQLSSLPRAPHPDLKAVLCSDVRGGTAWWSAESSALLRSDTPSHGTAPASPGP